MTGLAPALARLRGRVVSALLQERRGGQGPHVDPEDPGTAPPATAEWSDIRRAAQESRAMVAFADTMRPPGGGAVRDGVIGDLAEYYDLTPDEVVYRCRHWEDESVEEWKAAPRDTPEGLAEFYNTVASWSFDLLWYSYLQTVGYAYPKHVVLADWLPPAPAGARLLDFGSGIGVTAQLFTALGYETTLADVSEPLLRFARWRLERRGVKAEYVHLPAALPADSYDVITALDTFAHVPDARQTARDLHRATRPGGLLVTNFDTRPRSDRNAWHLYEDDLPLRWAIESSGWVPVKFLDGYLWIYRAEPADGARTRRTRAWLRLASPPARGLRASRRGLTRAALWAIQRTTGRAR